VSEYGAGRPAGGGEPGTASRVLLLLLGLLGFVLSPAIATSPATAGLGQGVVQQTVSLKKSAVQGAPRASRGGRGSASAERSGTHVHTAAAAPAPSAQAHGPVPAVLPPGAVRPAPVQTFAVDAPSRAADPVSGALIGTPRGRAPPFSTGF
jgi:hypothetical protein